MKKKLFIGLTTIVLTALLFTSCSKLPQAEIDSANLAIQNAKDAGADMYAHENFILLQDSMKSVMANIEAKKSKFFKNYKTSVEDLAGITQFAQDVKQQVKPARKK